MYEKTASFHGQHKWVLVILVPHRLMKSENTFQTFSLEQEHFDIKASVTNVTFELDVTLCPNFNCVQICSTWNFFILSFLTKESSRSIESL